MKISPSPYKNAASHFIFNVEHLGLAVRGPRSNAFTSSRELLSLATQLEWLFSNVVVPDFRKQLAIYFDGGCDSHPAAFYLLNIDLGVVIDNGCLLDACLAAVLAAFETASWPRLVAVSLPPQTNDSMSSALKLEFKEKSPSEDVCVYAV